MLLKGKVENKNELITPEHVYKGFCPDEFEPHANDPKCPMCQIIKRGIIRDDAWVQYQVDAALERAARQCEKRIVGKAMANQCAIDIRALKGKEESR